MVQRRSHSGKLRYPDRQSLSNKTRWHEANTALNRHYPLLAEKKTAGPDASVPVNRVEADPRRNISEQYLPRAVAHAVAVLKNEHVIACPLRSVFGVGCDLTANGNVCLLELKLMPVEKRIDPYRRQL